MAFLTHCLKCAVRRARQLLSRLAHLVTFTRKCVADLEADELRLRQQVRTRLHVHLIILVFGIVLINICLTVGGWDQATLYVTWIMSGCQELVDYVRRF